MASTTTTTTTREPPSRRRRSGMGCFNPLPAGNVALEWVTLTSLCAIAATTGSPWNDKDDHDSNNDNVAWKYRILAALPVSYATSYVLSRVYMTLSITIKQPISVQLHRMTGCFCLFYALFCWYKAIFILPSNTANNGNDTGIFACLDSVAWYLAYASALMNMLSGLSITPLMPVQTTPIHYYRMFPLSIILTLDVMLVRLAIRTFTSPNQAFFPYTTTTTLLDDDNSNNTNAASLYTWWCAIVLLTTFIVNLLVTALTARTIQLLSKQQQHHQPASPDQDLYQFLYNVFVDPSLVDKSSRALPSGAEQEHQQGQINGNVNLFSWAKNVFILVALGIVPALVFCQVPINLALHRTSFIYNKTAVAFTLNALDMLCVAVLPTFLLDTTLVLTKRLPKERVKVEVCMAFFLTVAAPFVLAPYVFNASDLVDLKQLGQVMLCPLFGSMETVLATTS